MTSDQLSEIEHKLIEFATKTAETILNQAGQIQAISHVLLFALVSLNELQPPFRSDFLDCIWQGRDQLGKGPVDSFTKDYIDELAHFPGDPCNYTVNDYNRPTKLKGIIQG